MIVKLSRIRHRANVARLKRGEEPKIGGEEVSQAGTGVMQMLAVVLCLGCAPASAADQVLTPDGLGPVKVGMTIYQAEKALGAKLRPRDTTFGTDACWHTARSDNTEPVSYKVWHRTIVSIQTSGDGTISPIATEKGIRVGDSDAKVKAAYGRSLKVRADSQVNEESEASVMTMLKEDEKEGLVFLTRDGKVVEIRAGLSAPIQAIDDC